MSNDLIERMKKTIHQKEVREKENREIKNKERAMWDALKSSGLSAAEKAANEYFELEKQIGTKYSQRKTRTFFAARTIAKMYFSRKEYPQATAWALKAEEIAFSLNGKCRNGALAMTYKLLTEICSWTFGGCTKEWKHYLKLQEKYEKKPGPKYNVYID